MTLKEQFTRDLQRAKPAEALVLNTLSALAKEYKFEDVSNTVKYYSKGDIKATAADGTEYMIEVKCDSRIADTYNILCEEEVYYKNSDYYKPGYMYNEYEYYAVVSEEKRTIYIFDFKQLQKIYKKGEFKILDHPHQYTEAYLLRLGLARKYGALLYELKY